MWGYLRTEKESDHTARSLPTGLTPLTHWRLQILREEQPNTLTHCDSVIVILCTNTTTSTVTLRQQPTQHGSILFWKPALFCLFFDKILSFCLFNFWSANKMEPCWYFWDKIRISLPYSSTLGKYQRSSRQSTRYFYFKKTHSFQPVQYFVVTPVAEGNVLEIW